MIIDQFIAFNLIYCIQILFVQLSGIVENARLDEVESEADCDEICNIKKKFRNASILSRFATSREHESFKFRPRCVSTTLKYTADATKPNATKPMVC